MNEPIAEMGLEQIDAILAYLPVFEGRDYCFGHWRTPAGGFPYFEFSAEVSEFISALYRQGFLVVFDWPGWSQRARYESDPAALEVTDLLTLRKLLTAHVRVDRLIEGHLASVLESGHIVAILRRLKEIRGQMADDA